MDVLSNASFQGYSKNCKLRSLRSWSQRFDLFFVAFKSTWFLATPNQTWLSTYIRRGTSDVWQEAFEHTRRALYAHCHGSSIIYQGLTTITSRVVLHNSSTFCLYINVISIYSLCTLPTCLSFLTVRNSGLCGEFVCSNSRGHWSDAEKGITPKLSTN